MTWAPSETPRTHRDDSKRSRSKSVISLFAVAAVSALAAGLTGVWWWNRDTGPQFVGDAWEPPRATLLSSPMEVMPVPGWRSHMTDLGLSNDVKFVERNQFSPQPFVGFLGRNGYFLARTTSGPADWLLLGVDAQSGESAFPPVSLGDPAGRRLQCMLNGPETILCIRYEVEGSTAWVIDADSGKVTYHGPTELTLNPGHLFVNQVGIYAVAEEMDKGVYGIGPRAETTWFVPGHGLVDRHGQDEFGAKPVATQLVGGPGSETKAVFRLSDGKVLNPPTDIGRRQRNAVVYPGGFALEVGNPSGPIIISDEILFFDDEGVQLGRVQTGDNLVPESTDLPMAQRGSGDTAVFTVDGRLLAYVPHVDSATSASLVGSRLFVNEGQSTSFPEWTSFDLQSGERGATCDFNVNGALDSDGKVLVIKVGNPEADIVAKGVDPVSCETLWRLPSEPKTSAEVFRVGADLVQISADGTSIFSLAAPHR